jgi:hypothetical protein
LRGNFWTTIGVVGLLYHAISMALLGSTPAAWVIDLLPPTPVGVRRCDVGVPSLL